MSTDEQQKRSFTSTRALLVLAIWSVPALASAQDAPARDPIAVARELGLEVLDEFDSHVCNYMQSAEDGLPDAQWNMGHAGASVIKCW